MTKFFEEFIKVSQGEFPMIKLASATYFKDKRELVVRFIISAFDVRDFDAAKEAKVLSILANMFNGVKVRAEYTRTYADVSVVKNKVVEYFNRFNQMVFRRLKDDNIEIFVSDKNIDVKLTFETPAYKMLLASKSVEGLHNYLDCAFNQNIDVSLLETVIDPKDAITDGMISIDTVVFRDTTLRLVDIRVGEKIYAKGKIAGVSQLPNYIADIKSAADNIVLCGKASNIGKKMYKNKKFDASNPKSGAEELPIVKFMLDDTTSKLECVCFPNAADAEKLENMSDGQQIVCIGNVGISAYNNALSYAINAVFKCEIDFKSINLISKKAVPENYNVITPKAFAAVKQTTLTDWDSDVIDDYFKNKTFVVYDLEATDRFPETAEITEIAAVKIVNGKPTETFATLINPLIPIPPFITEKTHISDEMVRDAPIIADVLPDFFKFTRDAILVGHNIIGYDYPLINKYASREGYNLDNDIVDTLKLSQKFLTEVKSHALEELSKSYNIAHENAHRALSDVIATYELLKIIVKRM